MICAEEAVTGDMIFLVSVPFLSFWGRRSWHRAEGSRTEQLTDPWCLTTLASHHMARVSREECKGGEEEQCPFALLVPFLYLHMGRRFSIRSLSPSGLSLQSRGSGTVTQHGGVQKVHTRKTMFSKSRKRKRKGLQELGKHYKKDLPIIYLCHL